MLHGQNTLQRVLQAMKNAGYDCGPNEMDGGLTSAQYIGMSPSGEVHRVTFQNPETGEQDEGRVYLKRDEHGVLKGEF